MRYRAKVTVVEGGKSYGPGSVLPEGISSGLMAFLREKKFVEPLDVGDAGDGAGTEGDFGGFGMAGHIPRKSPEEIYRIRSKKEVCIYADSIGLDLWKDYEGRNLKDLQQQAVDFQEEQAAGAGEG